MSDDGTTVACPVEGCPFRDTASLVAVHVNGNQDADHDWDALRFGGPRDFLQQARRGWLGDGSEDDSDSPDHGGSDPVDETSDSGEEGNDGESIGAEDSRSAGETTSTAGAESAEPGPIPVGAVRCPADSCHYTGELASVKAHISGTHDPAHDSDRLRERGIYPDEDDVKGGVGSDVSVDSTDDSETTTGRADADESASADTNTGLETATNGDTATATDETTTALGDTATDDDRITGDTTVAELLDRLDSVESRDVPVDTAAVETALVFCALLSDLADDPDTRTLVDAYTLASDLASAAGDARTDLRDELLARTDTDGELAGEVGRVRRVTRTRRTMKDDEEVLARLREAGVDETSVLRPDSKRVRETLESANLSESLAFDVSESSYVQKADSDADAKRARLAALRRRSEE